MNYQNTRRGFTQENKEVVIKQSIIPEFSSGSSTHVVTQQPRQAWKTLKQVQGLSNFIPLRGFTLIELLVVVLIIGILSAIALPQYQKSVKKARAVQGLVKITALDKAQRAYYLANGTFTTDLNNLDIENIVNACSQGNQIFFCQAPSAENMFFEWQGNSSGKTKWICGAKTSDEMANELCAAYWEHWGKSDNPLPKENGYTYYHGIWK